MLTRTRLPDPSEASSWFAFSRFNEETRGRPVAMGMGTVGQSGTLETPSIGAGSRFGRRRLSWLQGLLLPTAAVLSAGRSHMAAGGAGRDAALASGLCPPAEGRSASQGCSGVRASPNPKLRRQTSSRLWSRYGHLLGRLRSPSPQWERAPREAKSRRCPGWQRGTREPQGGREASAGKETPAYERQLPPSPC